MKNTDSTAVRVYDRNLQAFPLTIDFYGPYALVVDYADGGMSEDDKTVAIDLISRFMYVEHSRIIWRERKKREGREQHEKEDDSLRVEVRENGLVFETELLSYADTGLFLDQAVTRAEVMAIARSARVLNLFSYTGSFSVYAAAGGAESVCPCVFICPRAGRGYSGGDPVVSRGGSFGKRAPYRWGKRPIAGRRTRALGPLF